MFNGSRNHGIIGTTNDESGSACNTNRTLTTTSRMSCKGAKLHYSIDCTPIPETGVLGFTELISELEAIARLPRPHQSSKLQELSDRKGLSVIRLYHLSAVIRLYGGAA